MFLLLGCSNKIDTSPSLSKASIESSPINTGIEAEPASRYKTQVYESYLQSGLNEDEPNTNPFGIDDVYNLLQDICINEGNYIDGQNKGDINVYSLDWSQRVSDNVKYEDASSLTQGETSNNSKSIEIANIPTTYTENGTVKQCMSSLKLSIDGGTLNYYVVVYMV